MPTQRWRVVIVNYRTGALAAKAARAALAAVGDDGEVVVVDSASGDDSCAQVQQTGVHVLALPENRGFGAALNAGVKGSQSEFLLCQNADITYGRDLIEAFERRFAELDGLAVIGPRLVSPDGTIQPSCRLFPSHWSLLTSRGSPLSWLPHTRYLLPEPPSFTLCDVVAGACFAVRRRVWDQLQGMDERFFLYAEDTDFCKRTKAAGHLVGYEPAVTARHVWGASTLQDRRGAGRHHARSLALYLRKHFPSRPFTNRLFEYALRVNASLRS